MEFSAWNRYFLEFSHASVIWTVPGVHADLVAGMAVVKGVQKATGLNAMIKWPNDAVVNGKKICGILTEMSTEEDTIRYVVVGDRHQCKCQRVSGRDQG